MFTHTHTLKMSKYAITYTYFEKETILNTMGLVCDLTFSLTKLDSRNNTAPSVSVFS